MPRASAATARAYEQPSRGRNVRVNDARAVIPLRTVGSEGATVPHRVSVSAVRYSWRPAKMPYRKWHGCMGPRPDSSRDMNRDMNAVCPSDFGLPTTREPPNKLVNYTRVGVGGTTVGSRFEPWGPRRKAIFVGQTRRESCGKQGSGYPAVASRCSTHGRRVGSSPI